MVTESEKRIDDLLEVVGEFELQCGAANNLVLKLQEQQYDNQV